MKKLILSTALVFGLSSVAVAEAPAIPALDLAIVSDTGYSIENETTNTEFGVEGSAGAINFAVLPTWSWDDSEISNIEVNAGYQVDISDKLSITPYGEMHWNNDFDNTDKVIGVKTRFKL